MNLELDKFHNPSIPDDDLAKFISSKLKGLGVSGFKLNTPRIGPIVTEYPIELSSSTKVKDILNKSEDLAIACDVESILIERKGKEIVISVPNKERKTIDFKDALYKFLNSKDISDMKIPLLLGTDTKGVFSVLELTNQPHILIAGSTNSGKSIFLANLIASLSLLKNPEELRFVLVDTKQLDLPLFSQLKHVKETVIDIQGWYDYIDILIGKVSERKKLFTKAGARNIEEYNAFADKKLPYILLVIDELADIIALDRDLRRGIKNYPYPKVEDSLLRLIQICRAVGIHVIACTQRTSVDIINGVIKANFPTRISLKLPTGIDSRTILDQNGAESLLGKGDMLLKSIDSDILKRYHSPFVKLDDIKNIIENRDMVLETMRRLRLVS